MTDASVDDVARRLSVRPGYRLVTYRQVGLPYWEVPLKCRILKKKQLPVLDEFVLRCMECGLRGSEDISSFLGLSDKVVDVVMGNLVISGHIVPVRDVSRDSVSYSLSSKGREAVRGLSEVTPEERTISLAYDGLRNKYDIVDRALRWRPRDLRERGILEIPAFPADPPPVGPRDTSSVAAVLQNVAAVGDSELLTVLGVEGKREKFFVRAIALVFESVDKPDEVSVRFAVDGRPSEEHDLAFAKAEGVRKLGIVGSLHESRSAVDSILGDQLLKERSDDVEVGALRRTTERFRAELKVLQARAETATPEQKELLADQATDVAQRLDLAEVALEKIPVRILEVHEHAPLLADALRSAQSRLMIVSPWIRAVVVDDNFIRDLERLLASGVQVVIGYGIDDGKLAASKDRAAETRLRDLSRKFPKFDFVRLGDTHAKVLIMDDRMAVVTSFNWLSFRGDPERPFRDERGTLVTIRDDIDRLYGDYLKRVRAVGAGAPGKVVPAER